MRVRWLIQPGKGGTYGTCMLKCINPTYENPSLPIMRQHLARGYCSPSLIDYHTAHEEFFFEMDRQSHRECSKPYILQYSQGMKREIGAPKDGAKRQLRTGMRRHLLEALLTSFQYCR